MVAACAIRRHRSISTRLRLPLASFPPVETSDDTVKVTADPAVTYGGRMADVCDVWWAGIDAAGPHLDRLLTTADRERIARFRQPADRDRGQVAWGVARILLGGSLGPAPAAVTIDRTCRLDGCGNGKPWVVDPPAP